MSTGIVSLRKIAGAVDLSFSVILQSTAEQICPHEGFTGSVSIVLSLAQLRRPTAPENQL